MVDNRILTKDRERTWATASVAAAGGSVTVKAIDSNSWADNDWFIFGEIGTPNAEILQVAGAVTDGTSLSFDNAGSGGCRYAHSVDEPLYRIDYNKVKFYRAATDASSGAALLATAELQPDDFRTRYDDQTNTTGYGFAQFLNTFTSGISPFSDGIPYAGQEAGALSSMISKVRTLVDEKDDDFLSDDEITNAINDKQRDIIDERLWTFNETSSSTSSILNQFEYDKPTLIKTLYSVGFKTEPLRSISRARWQMIHWNTSSTATNPTHTSIWNNKVGIYPKPAASANTTTLNGGISASATSITVVSTTGFTIGDYYRFTIDSEIIYATGLDATTPTTLFTGCLRGQEGTTAATHLTAATVTENDIVYYGQAVATDLNALNAITVVPEPIVICYGVAVDFCNGKLNKPTLGDRYEIKYKAGIDNLRDRFSLKLTSQYGRVKDPREVISDNGAIRDPNDYPSGVMAPPLI